MNADFTHLLKTATAQTKLSQPTTQLSTRLVAAVYSHGAITLLRLLYTEAV